MSMPIEEVLQVTANHFYNETGRRLLGVTLDRETFADLVLARAWGMKLEYEPRADRAPGSASESSRYVTLNTACGPLKIYDGPP